MTALELTTSPIDDTNTKFPTITKTLTPPTTTITSLKSLHQPASSLATPPNSPHVLHVTIQAMSLTPADSLNTNLDDPATHTEAALDSSQLAQSQNIEQLKARINSNNETLRQSLETSYRRLRLIQTKSFQTHVAQQLNTILELKQKQKLESTVAHTQAPVVSGVSDCVADVIDATSVDLLTSILKSNLSNNEESATDTNTATTAARSLLDDIQYEILKESDEIKNFPNSKSHQSTDSATDDEDLTDDADDQNTSLADLAADNECSVDWNSSSSVARQPEKTLTDSSNIFWAKNRAHLGCEWTRVQTKMKQLKSKFKQCNDFLARQTALENCDKQLNSNKNSGYDIFVLFTICKL